MRDRGALHGVGLEVVRRVRLEVARQLQPDARRGPRTDRRAAMCPDARWVPMLREGVLALVGGNCSHDCVRATIL